MGIEVIGLTVWSVITFLTIAAFSAWRCENKELDEKARDTWQNMAYASIAACSIISGMVVLAYCCSWLESVS